MKKNIFKKMAMFLSVIALLTFSVQTAKACTLVWCGATITCSLTPCEFNVGSQFAFVTCGETVTILECVPNIE